MMDRTDRHERYFLRLISRRALLYTEMIPTGAILRGDRARFLDFDPAEHPVALQLGGGDPDDLAACCRIAEDWGYDEVNLNLGCPSDRVSHARFGACLMAEPDLVARCLDAMRRATRLPVTVKTRIGIDEADGYDEFERFVAKLATTGVETFIIHARKAWLNGLSPRENREIPPLRYDFVHRLKAARPDLMVILNGGIKTTETALAQIGPTDGVMIGRAAYDDPLILAAIEAKVSGEHRTPARDALVEAYADYVDRRLAEGVPLWRMTRHVLGLYQGLPGARAWRRALGEGAHRPGETGALLRRAAALVRDPDRLAA
jgi:tRNA-dihydrouridine synthase A